MRTICAIATAALLVPCIAVAAARKPLPALPPAALRTVETYIGRGQIMDVTTDTAEGQTTYDIEFKLGTTNRSFTVASDGKLLNWEVFMSEVPQAVQKIIRDQAGAGRVGRIDRVLDSEEN